MASLYQVGPVIDPSNPEPKTYVGQYITAGFSGHGMPRAFAWYVDLLQFFETNTHNVRVATSARKPLLA